jgi:predicted O-methyltransferase YrrM
MSSPTHILTSSALAPGSTELLVMSPLATMRWRQGQLRLSSPRHPKTLVIDCDLASLLLDLVEPRTVSFILKRQSNISCADRRTVLAILIDLGIVELAKSRCGIVGKVWWDPKDKAHDEAVVLQLIQIAHGFARSADEGFSVDHRGRPLPRIARPALDFLFQLDLSQLSIFEYGGGASTFYWDRRCAALVTVESNKEWADHLMRGVGPRSRILYRPEQHGFAESILESDDRYDIILIDAVPDFRCSCVEPALERLSARGMIILDDAPFYPHAAEVLRKARLIEVDVTGFSSLEDNLQTTSLFLSRAFDLPRRATPSPAFPFGSPGFDWRALDAEN